MQISYFPMSAVRITGSEQIASHVGTTCLDMAYGTDPWAYAPFDVRVWRLYHSTTNNSNTVFFESVAPVQAPAFADHISFFMGHMNDVDFKAMGYAVGKTFKQGERIYKQGIAGMATGAHIHFGAGRGKFMGNGWYKTDKGTWAPYTTGKQVHMWDAVFLKKGTQIIPTSTIASTYKWVVVPDMATMVDVKNKAIVTGAVTVNMRAYPSTSFSVVGQLPLNSEIPITQESANLMNGFKWVKVTVGGVTGYSALVSSIELIETLTPEEELQKQLDEANARIKTLEAENALLKSQLATSNAELQKFVLIEKPVYEKIEGGK